MSRSRTFSVLGAVLCLGVAGCARDASLAGVPPQQTSHTVRGVPKLSEMATASRQPETTLAPSVPQATPTPSVESPAPASSAASTSQTPTPSPAPTPSSTPSSTPTPDPATLPAILKSGDEGEKVRELQHRLLQLDWYAGKITPHFGSSTEAAVQGFQGKRNLPTTGEVDQKTWDALAAMTRQPTRDEMHNVLKAGPALLKSGDKGDKVKDLQARLKQIDWYAGPVTGTYDAATVKAVRDFQAKRQIPVTGEVDQRTLDQLGEMTSTPTAEELSNKPPKKPAPPAIDQRCMTGRVLCISKSTNQLAWVVDGKVLRTMDVRFGSELTPTREGVFTLYWKSRDHVSTLYHTAMPYAMFFSGGQAVHYSADFAARGYNGASHGCVNVRDKDAVSWLFGQAREGDKVVVHR